MAETAHEAKPAASNNVFEDLVEVFWRPSVVFDRTRAGTAGRYLIVTALVGLVLILATRNLITPWIDAQADLSLKLAALRGKPIPEAAAGRVRSMTSTGMLVSIPIIMLVGPYLNAVLMLIGGKLAGARLTYKQATVIAALAGVPRLLGFFTNAMQGLLLDESHARGLLDLTLGPARFLDPLQVPAALLGVIGSVDVFRVWQLVLMAIGVSVVARVSRGAGAGVAMVVLALSAIGQLIPGALF